MWRKKSADNAEKVRTPVLVSLPKKRYGTIVIDPPWDMEKIERQVRPNQHGFDYPTMSEAALAPSRRCVGRARLARVRFSSSRRL
jgi:hypothetical protein